MSKAKINQQRIQNLKDLGMDIPGNLLDATSVLGEEIDEKNRKWPNLKRHEGYSDFKEEVDLAFKSPDIKHLMVFLNDKEVLQKVATLNFAKSHKRKSLHKVIVSGKPISEVDLVPKMKNVKSSQYLLQKVCCICWMYSKTRLKNV